MKKKLKDLKRNVKQLDGFSIPFAFYMGRQQRNQTAKSYSQVYSTLPGAILTVISTFVFLIFFIYMVT